MNLKILHFNNLNMESLKNPTANTNYLLSDQILVGGYPLKDSEESDANELFDCNNISSIIKTGRNIFINLTTKYEKNKYYKYMNIVTDKVDNPIFINYEIEDHDIPNDINSFRRFIKLLYVLIKDKTNKLYIHCAGGHGRTGLVCCCLLKEMGYTNIFDLVQQWHSTRDNMPNYPSPENHKQDKFVTSY